MKDVFYTILFVWLVSRLFSAFSSGKSKPTTSTNNSSNTAYKKEGETKVEFIPPQKKHLRDDAGEYVDYEEVK